MPTNIAPGVRPAGHRFCTHCLWPRGLAPRRQLPPSLRTPADFKVKKIKADRKLTRDADYVAEFTNVPIRVSDLDIPLDVEEYALLQKLKLAEIYGDDEGAALHDFVFSWWEETCMGRL